MAHAAAKDDWMLKGVQRSSAFESSQQRAARELREGTAFFQKNGWSTAGHPGRALNLSVEGGKSMNLFGNLCAPSSMASSSSAPELSRSQKPRSPAARSDTSIAEAGRVLLGAASSNKIPLSTYYDSFEEAQRNNRKKLGIDPQKFAEAAGGSGGRYVNPFLIKFYQRREMGGFYGGPGSVAAKIQDPSVRWYG
eukprot:gnl/TRDRNA2_/TRDRNA2_163722_c3_seq1.p1 gnl/TRDRNA2_/TRDRNA2_163722_c3~~gnl/TRDRNA2_/TRDRNA2_163722_c3_seq1.p1  ORF type:complete len:218 (+),score=32.38 gnl/TRDRNA2_/TRDRNA2_163722_c3_seq1:73-654(+)